MDPIALTKEELIQHISKMNAEMLALQERLQQSKDQGDWISNAMKARTRVLNERVKELRCVHQLFQIFRSPDLRFEQRIGRIVDLLPKAWQYSDMTCARAVIDGREFRTHKYRNTQWAMKEQILAKGCPRGTVEVCYLKERPSVDDGPFLREERLLLKSVAECLGAICEIDQPS